MTPTRESAPSMAPPAKKSQQHDDQRRLPVLVGNEAQGASSVFWSENTSRMEKMMSRMAQVSAVMTFNKKGQ
jgi:hypothetical protein